VDDLGYSTFEAVLTKDECEDIIGGLSSLVRVHGRAGIRNLMSNPAIFGLAGDERLISIAARILGGRALPFSATLFEKCATTNWNVSWHQDRALPLSRRVSSEEWGPWSIKRGVLYALAPAWALEGVVALRIHLDASTLENGPLQVIPGTHKDGVLVDHDIIRLTRDRSWNTCVVASGGVLAMRPLLLHSSMKVRNTDPRRVIHIEYADSLELGKGVQLSVA